MPDTELVETPDEADVIPCDVQPLTTRDKELKRLLTEARRGDVLRLSSVASLVDIAEAVSRKMGGADGFADVFVEGVQIAREKKQAGHLAQFIKLHTSLVESIGDAGQRLVEDLTDSELAQGLVQAAAAIGQQNPDLLRALATMDDSVITEGR